MREMPKYTAEFTYENINKDGFSFPLKSDNFEDAAAEAIEEIKTRGIITENGMNGRIKDLEGKYYEIFGKNDWLINPKTGRLKTGKKVSSLEEKLD